MSAEPPNKKQIKADAAAEKARAKAERPLWKKKRFVIPAVLLVLIVLVSVTSGGDDGPDEDAPVAGTDGDGADETAEAEDAEAEDAPEEAPDEAEFAGIGEEARDGDFAFTVNSIENIGPILESSNDFVDDLETSGTFYRLDIRVENIGDEAQRMSASNQYLYDAEERQFSATSSMDLIGMDIDTPVFEQLNPGASVEGQIIFDVPADAIIEFAELHDSAFSGGVLVDLR